MKRSLLSLSFLLCVFLAACSGGTSSPTSANTNSGSVSTQTSQPSVLPNTLQVTRTDLSSTDNIGPFDKTVTDVSQVQKVYQTALGLPVYSAGQEVNEACLNDTGVVYHMIFLQGSKEVQRMNLDPGDCKLLSLSATDLRQVDDAFLQLFKQAVQLDSLI